MSDIPNESYTNVSSDLYSNSVSLRGFNGFSTQILITNGATFTANAYIQVSNNGQNWVTIDSSVMALAGVTDSGIFDIPITGTSFYRVYVDVLTGSANITLVYNVKDR